MRHLRTDPTSRSFTNTPTLQPPSPATPALILNAQLPLRPNNTEHTAVHALLDLHPDLEFQSNARRPLTGLGIRLSDRPLVIDPSREQQDGEQDHDLNRNPFASLSLHDICILDSSPPDCNPPTDNPLDQHPGTETLLRSPESSIGFYRGVFAHSDRPYSPLPIFEYPEDESIVADYASIPTFNALTPATTAVGLFPDISMFAIVQQDAGINPAEIMNDKESPSPSEDSPLPASSSPSPSPLFGDDSDYADSSPAPCVLSPDRCASLSATRAPSQSPSVEPISAQAMNDIVAILSAAVHKEAQEAQAVSSAHSPCAFETHPDTPPSVHSPTLAHHRRSKAKQQRPPSDDPRKYTTYDPRVASPVFNAHVGIELTDLQARAAAYRMAHPGEEINAKWLMAYAGKLSTRGELVDDFRCYVIGCTQVNKRRDHILTHVGGHVGQRPFKCPLCPMRFLRKNECKRHEASHSGNRPYVCDLCSPYDEKCFVRQDLLKRHLKRTHGLVTFNNNKENIEPPRKKSRRE